MPALWNPSTSKAINELPLVLLLLLRDPRNFFVNGIPLGDSLRKGWSFDAAAASSWTPPTNDTAMVIIQKLNTVPQKDTIVTPNKTFHSKIHWPLSLHLTSSPRESRAPSPVLMKRHAFHSRILPQHPQVSIQLSVASSSPYYYYHHLLRIIPE